jgi:Kyakuja-Dileera-Zisupton transposase
MGQLPSYMQIDDARLSNTVFVLPKMHIYGHGSSCQTKYSLNFIKFSARMNGEEVERWWAHINPASMSTREMGEGAREDTLDDHARSWNWRKITNFGKYQCLVFFSPMLMCTGQSFQSQFRKAITMHEKHRSAFEKFNVTFPEATVKEWEKQVAAWDADRNQPNPYEMPAVGTYMIAIYSSQT